MTASAEAGREAENQQLRSPWWRLQGVFFEPATTFSEINRRPNWLLPLALLLLAALASTAYFISSVGPENLILQGLNQNPRYQEASPDEKQQILERSLNPIVKTMMYAGPVFLVPLLLMLAGVLTGCLILAGKESRFGKIFSVVCHSWFASGLIGAGLLSLVILLTEDPASLDLGNPLQSNLGFLVGKDSPVLKHLASSIDALRLYMLYLTSLGLSKISRLSLGGALTLMGSLWLVWILAGTLLVYLFS